MPPVDSPFDLHRHPFVDFDFALDSEANLASNHQVEVNDEVEDLRLRKPNVGNLLLEYLLYLEVLDLHLV